MEMKRFLRFTSSGSKALANGPSRLARRAPTRRMSLRRIDFEQLESRRLLSINGPPLTAPAIVGQIDQDESGGLNSNAVSVAMSAAGSASAITPLSEETTIYLPEKHSLYEPGGYLTAPSAGDPVEIALAYVSASADILGLSPTTIANAVVTDSYTTPQTGTTHVYLGQTHLGLPVANVSLNINVDHNGQVVSVYSDFVPGLDEPALGGASSAVPQLAPIGALEAAGRILGLAPSEAEPAPPSGASAALDATTVYSAPWLSLDDVPMKMMYVPTATGLELAWDLVVRTPDDDHWYDMTVSAASGDLVFANDWVEHATYNVIAPPTESPLEAGRTLQVDPQLPVPSPYGWHDTNGAPGAEYTDTRGNNVFAQEDGNNDNAGGYRPNGGGSLNFDFPLNLNQPPSGYQDAAITNLFYWNNWVHDVSYNYGFNEAAGNFQVSTYGRGGLGFDAVQADAQDGGGMNNANFATPPDGIAPRMQVYIWNYSLYGQDGDFDSELITHEYGHGISNRLTGGPDNPAGLVGLQSRGMGEGWSDWLALLFTMEPTDAKMDPYGFGNFVIGLGPAGPGIRTYPYSFDMGIDPLTLNRYNSTNEVHDTGEIWCSALWDMTWLLIDKYGFDSNLAGGYAGPGSAGNLLAMQLVIDAMKLQPANPTFLDARDAILQADFVLTGGDNRAEIWTAFARRGFGLSADVGSDANSTFVIEAFDTPSLNMSVYSTTPAIGSVVSSPVSDFTVRFTDAYVPGTIDASDFNVNGNPANSFTFEDSKRVTFHFASSPVTAQGLQTMTIDAGDVERTSDNGPIDPFSATFRYDVSPITVTGTTPSSGSSVTLPLTEFQVNFSEPYLAGSIDVSDLVLSQGTVTGFSFIDADTVQFDVSVSAEGTIDVTIPAGAVADIYGNTGPAYSGNFISDVTTIAFPSSLTGVVPAGSLVYRSSYQGTIFDLIDTDSFTLTLDPGQTLAVTVEPSATLQPRIDVSGPGVSTSASALAAGSAAVLQPVPVPGGTYTITVSGLSSTMGSYTLRPLLNAAVEAEEFGGVNDDTIITAQNINSAFTALGAGSSRAAVLGTGDYSLPHEIEPNGSTAAANDATLNFAARPTNLYHLGIKGSVGVPLDQDWYYIGELQAGDVITMTASGAGSNRGSIGDSLMGLFTGPILETVEVFNDGGGPGLDALVYRYTIPTTRTYYVGVGRLYDSLTGSYDLGLYLETSGAGPQTGGTLTAEVESNDTGYSANDASTSWRRVQYVAPTSGQNTFGDADYYKYQFTAGSLVSINATSTDGSRPRVALLDSSDTTIAFEDGLSDGPTIDSFVNAFIIPSTGTYYVKVESASGSGSYDLNVYLSSTTPPPAPTSTLDTYSLSLSAGDVVTVGIKGLSGASPNLKLLNSSGTLLALGTSGSTNLDQVITHFIVSSSDTYYIQLGPNNPFDYDLVVTKNASFDTQPNDSLITAQILAPTSQVLGNSDGITDHFYKMQLTEGETASLLTSTPGDAGGQFVNTFDPAVDLYNPSGTLVGSNDNGSFDARNALLQYVPPPGGSGIYTARVRAVAGHGEFLLTVGGAINSSAQIVGRRLFYNQSGTGGATVRYDGNNLAINSLDDNAIATDKVAYLPEDAGAATFANVSSYSKGINGIMIDIAGVHGSITAADFEFHVGNNNTPSTWALANPPTSISVRAGAGVSGSDRVEIIWNSGAPFRQWLEVIALSNAHTGLPQKVSYPVGQADAFFFGNAAGDTGAGDTSVNATVNAVDEGGARNNPQVVGNNIPITNIYDVNRNAVVNAVDEGIIRNNNTNSATVLKYLNLASPPAAPDGGGGGGSGGGDAGIASALAVSASGNPQATVPRWLGLRLDELDLNSGRVAQAFQSLHDFNTPTARKLLVRADHIADALGLEHELLDWLLADLGLA